MKKILSAFFGIILLVTLVACSSGVEPENLWDNATYTENTEFGEGKATVFVEVIAHEKTVEFTIHTDKEILGDALLEHKLISGEEGAYGLYIKEVNGIFADYVSTKSYWSINKDGEYMNTGVDSEKITDGARYQLVYTEAE